MALYSRVKTWVTEVLSASDLNAEFDNIITKNSDTTYITGASADTTAMQNTTSPGAVGSESLATNVLGEIQRLRFAIKRITGAAQWYSAPTFDLTGAGSRAFSVYKTSSQTVALGAPGVLTWDAEYFDKGSCFASNKFTADIAGVYQFSATVNIREEFNGVVYLRVNGSTKYYPVIFDQLGSSSSFGGHYRSISYVSAGPINLSATDYVEVVVDPSNLADAETNYLIPLDGTLRSVSGASFFTGFFVGL